MASEARCTVCDASFDPDAVARATGQRERCIMHAPPARRRTDQQYTRILERLADIEDRIRTLEASTED